VIKNTPKDKSENSSNNQEYQQIKRYVPDDFLQPEWPQSETHESQDDNHDQCQIKFLTIRVFFFDYHVNTFIHHWSTLSLWNNEFWCLLVAALHKSWIFSKLEDVLAQDHVLTELNRIFNGLELGDIATFSERRNHFHNLWGRL